MQKKCKIGGNVGYNNNNVPTQSYIDQQATNKKKYDNLMRLHPEWKTKRGSGLKGRGIGDFFRSLGNRDTWKNVGNKIVTAVKQPLENVKNLGRATKDAFESMKDSTNWKNAILNPKDWSKGQLNEWLKNNKVVSSTLGTFGTAAGPVVGAVMENGARALGYGLKRKRVVKRKKVGGKLF